MDINQIIEELENELYSNAKSFLWNKKAFVEKCGSLVEELKRNLPTALKEANYLLSQRDKILFQAQETAKKTISEAEAQATQIVSQSELVRRAEEQAREIVENANKRTSQMYAATKSNLDKMLKSVEDYLTENLHIVRNNREELNGALFSKKKSDDDED